MINALEAKKKVAELERSDRISEDKKEKQRNKEQKKYHAKEIKAAVELKEKSIYFRFKIWMSPETLGKDVQNELRNNGYKTTLSNTGGGYFNAYDEYLTNDNVEYSINIEWKE